jgi:hypothetical protein
MWLVGRFGLPNHGPYCIGVSVDSRVLPPSILQKESFFGAQVLEMSADED